MKVLASLRREQAEVQTIQVIADGTATAHDVAVAIVSAGREELIEPSRARLTLRIDADDRPARTLDPEVPLAESGVRSGVTFAVVEAQGEGDTRVGAVVRIVAGPDRGIEVPIRVGGSLVGRSPECQVRLRDPRVSATHAKIVVGRELEIMDIKSSNGVLVGAEKINRAVLKPGDTAVLGHTHLQVHRVGGAIADDTATEIRFLRPPVVQSRPQAGEIELPDLPSAPARTPFPWLALLAPLVMGAIMFATTRSAMSLLFVAMSPVLMLAGYVGNVIDGRRKRKSETTDFEAAMTQVEADIVDARGLETTQLRRLYPSVAECVQAAVDRDARLWCRRPEHPEFLHVRLGTGAIPARVVVKEPGRTGAAELTRRQRELAGRSRLLADVPVVADLRSVGGIGLAGPVPVVSGVARGVVAQVATMHSPAELVIVCLTSSALKGQWSWLEWLPHTSSPHSPIPGSLLAADSTRGRALVDQLEELVTARGDSAQQQPRGPLEGQERPTAPMTPSVLVVVHDAAVGSERVVSIAERGPDVGVHVLWVAAERAQLPASCRTYLDLPLGGEAVVGMVRSERVIRGVATESLDLHTAHLTARRLAPVVDASVPVEDDTDLPRSVSVIGLLGHRESTEPAEILDRWRENGSFVERAPGATRRERPADLRALVGHGGLSVFTLDLRAQGPHALVGGTTGSGKSEFLQAWVLGMAHAYSPDHVTFLFVDYKGGAAFAKADELPHCVGTVTDLSPYLVRRALRSLRAEIRRREHLFNAKGVKDLIAFERTGDPDCPPSLIIVVDEFAALVGEVPEFVDGVIDVAQRGRSLGLHLILATQRPAGVIKDSLRANTNLRIALRVNDAHDSSDVLGSPQAASIDPSTPGRGVARVGPSRLIPFQSAFPGALTPAETPAPPIDVDEVDFGQHVAWKIPRPTAQGPAVDKDIVRVVDAIGAAARQGRVPAPRRPWLNTLSAAYDLSRLNQRSDQAIVLGVVDDPDNQLQQPTHFRPDDSGSIVYFGAGGSGKTSALRSLAIAASITPRSGPVHVYALDFAGGGLSMLDKLPTVGAVIGGDDDERVARLMSMLSVLLDARAPRYNEVGADSLSAYRRQPGRAGEPRVLVLVDGFGSFREEYDSGLQRQAVFAQFQRLVNEGRGVGIHFAVTVDRPSALPSSMQGAFQHRVVLRMPDADAYMALGVPKDVLDHASPPGRALSAHDPNELHLATLGRDPSPVGQAREIEQLAAVIVLPSRPEPVRSLPKEIAASDVPVTVGGLPTLGMEDRSLAFIGFDPQGTYVVAGPPKSGVSSAVRWLAESMRRALPAVPRVLLTPRASELAGLSLWTAQVTGTAQIKDYLATKLAPYLESAAGAGTPSVAIVVDRFGELIGSEVDGALTEALKQVRRNGHLLIATGDTSSFSPSGFSNLLTEIKNGKAGLLLQPQPGDGDLVKTQLPRFRPADFPRGRGYWIANNAIDKVQLPEVE